MLAQKVLENYEVCLAVHVEPTPRLSAPLHMASPWEGAQLVGAWHCDLTLWIGASILTAS